jgi:zona occludens toxin
MSIVAYTGLPGSGKSYGVVENVIIPALKAGRHLIHNMPLEQDKLCAEYPAGTLTKLPEGCDAATAVSLCDAGAVVVLDEVWRYWPSGMKDHTIPEAQKEFFAMHRHKVADGFSMEIVLVTQDLSQVAMFCRSLVEQTFRSVKLTAIGSKNKFRIDVFEGPVTGAKPPQARRIRQMYGRYDPAVYAFYKSHTLSQDGSAGTEEKADGRGNMLKGWRFKLSVLALIVAPLLAFAGYRSMMGFVNKVQGKPSGSAVLPQNSPNGSPQPVPPPKPQPSKQWRYAGQIVVNGFTYFILQGEDFSRRISGSECRKDSGDEWVCDLDGEIVTAWSGPPPPAFNQWFAGTASARADSNK